MRGLHIPGLAPGSGRLPRALAWLCLAALPVLSAACGPELKRAEVEDLRRRLEDTERRRAQGQQRVDELENRVFLLTDQVESAKLAATASVRSRQERLPVVTLRPREDDESESETEIEYQGAARAREPDRARPVLQLEGKMRQAVSIGREPSARSENVGDSLGVAPAPPITVASRAADATSRAREMSSNREPPPASVKDAPPRPAPEPLHKYQAAYEVLRAGRSDEAAALFREFVREYPAHDYADNAQYWLGEAYYARQRYADAAPEFRAVFRRYPLGNKAPDAMVKLGYCLIAQGDAKQARAVLDQVSTTYPRTEAARLASAKLAELGAAQGEGAQR